ncbi:MAG: GTPase, partial [archaeon]|nr:GTPase [archaeon]
MSSEEEKIKKLEDELEKTPSNKATQHHRGLLKAKIADLQERKDRKASGTGTSLGGYSVKKSGDATVVLIGFPSVGKSTLLNRITNAESEVGGYDFTTLEVIPGMMEYEGAKIQILDVPGIIKGAAQGKGRGREIFSVVNNSDLIIIMSDVVKVAQIDVIKNELYEGRVRLNKKKPDVTIEKTSRDGISVNTAIKLSKIDEQTVKAVLNGHKITNANVIIRDDITDDELTDVIVGNRKYVPMIIIVNKIDCACSVKDVKIDDKDVVFISAQKGYNIDALKMRIYSKLGLIKIYTKPVGKEADMDE